MTPKSPMETPFAQYSSGVLAWFWQLQKQVIKVRIITPMVHTVMA